jgi:hypothetical protein
MERFCGVLGSVAKQGRRYPYTALSNRIYQHALLNFFENRYNIGLKKIFAAKRRNEHADDELMDDARVDGGEYSLFSLFTDHLSFSIADIRLIAKTRGRVDLDSTTKRRIAKYFPILVDDRNRKRYKIKITDFEKRLPLTAEKYLKMQIVNGGDTIRGVGDDIGANAGSSGQENSFVRVRQTLLLECWRY